MAQNEFSFNLNNINKIYFADASPTAGTYVRGDLVLNSAPSAGGVLGWICVTAGSPGTFQPVAAVAGPYTLDSASINTLTVTGVLTTSNKEVHTPATPQTLTAATAITTVGHILPITAAALTTLTVAPSIADGTNGQDIVLLNVGSNGIVIQDQGTLASSNLRLGVALTTIAARGSARLVFNSTINDWVQIGNQAVI